MISLLTPPPSKEARKREVRNAERRYYRTWTEKDYQTFTRLENQFDKEFLGFDREKHQEARFTADARATAEFWGAIADAPEEGETGI